MASEASAEPEEVHVVGPVRVASKWIFLCPECDSDRCTTQPSASQSDTVVQCTTQWLRGQYLRGDDRAGNRACYCFESDPYDDEGGDEINNKRRFFHYITVALLLGGGGKRVDLPLCVRDRIEDLFGESRTGFSAGAGDDAES